MPVLLCRYSPIRPVESVQFLTIADDVHARPVRRPAFSPGLFGGFSGLGIDIENGSVIKSIRRHVVQKRLPLADELDNSAIFRHR